MLSINPPGPVSFYFNALVSICTFDPIDLGMILEHIPVLEFDVVQLPTDRVFFSRIGIPDRNFVMVLGSALIIISIFLIFQLTFGILYVVGLVSK